MSRYTPPSYRNARKKPTIHYIGEEWNSKFIITETNCGKYWKDVEEFTSQKELVTCKKCIKKLNQL